MLGIRNQIICLSIAMLLMICFQPDQVNGQIKKKKLLKGLMGAGLLKLLKPKKGVLPIPLPLPLPLPIDWHTQAGLLSKNNPPTHVSHQPYPQSGIQMSPIEYSEYQNAISQALSNGNSYIPSGYSYSSVAGSPGSSGSSGPSGYSPASSGQNENSNSDGYNSNTGSMSNNYDSSSGSNNYGSSSGSNSYDSSSGSNSFDSSSVSNNYGSSSGSNSYDSSSGSNNYGGSSNGYDGSSNYGSNSGSASYQLAGGMAGVGQNDEYNAYQVSNNDNSGSSGYRAAASSINPNYNTNFPRMSELSEAIENTHKMIEENMRNNQRNKNFDTRFLSRENGLASQINSFLERQTNKGNLQDNSGAASSDSFIATSNQQQQNNYIPLRSVPMYQMKDSQQSNYQTFSNSQQQKPFSSNGWVALD